MVFSFSFRFRLTIFVSFSCTCFFFVFIFGSQPFLFRFRCPMAGDHFFSFSCPWFIPVCADFNWILMNFAYQVGQICQPRLDGPGLPGVRLGWLGQAGAISSGMAQTWSSWRPASNPVFPTQVGSWLEFTIFFSFSYRFRIVFVRLARGSALALAGRSLGSSAQSYLELAWQAGGQGRGPCPM